jgi:hypothetical protein
MPTRQARAVRTEASPTWKPNARSPELQRYRGLWVALDHCRYDAKTAQPVEGEVVDADEDLAELCSRIRSEDNRHCAIVFCEGEGTVEEFTPPPDSKRSSSPSLPPNLVTH